MSAACRVLASLSIDVLTLAEKPFKEMRVTMDRATHNTKTIAWRRERAICRMVKRIFKRPLVMSVLYSQLICEFLFTLLVLRVTSCELRVTGCELCVTS